MYKLILKAFLITSLIILSNCGFKVLDNAGSNDFNIKEIEVNGDNNRINFKIKNGILNNSREDSVNDIILKISIKKNKNIKEKNIKNEITKYEIEIKSEAKIYIIKADKTYNMPFFAKGMFNVNQKYSTTINNEKRLIENLTNQITDKIIQSINIKINDF
tara:strand:- start:170 stop:649 length:480 start_codon:yes stop_codon:yes gene_type:complete